MRYIVTQEIKSETQVLWFIYLQDLAFLAVWTMLVLVLKENVHGYLRIPYYIVSFIVGGIARERKSETPILSGIGNLHRKTEKNLPIFQGGEER